MNGMQHISSIIARASAAANSSGTTSGGSAGGPDSKRRKVAGFKPGYIVKVIVQNFTTYSYAEFNLSPSLNMIIGPNGTGKSTLVSAICLGLGGKLELIKRKNLKSMIKTGQTSATLDITLQNREGEPPLVIRRVFNEKESQWYLNNARSTEAAIRKLVKSFNIQLDNLCHFLPQERVAEFASLSPEKLLLEIERTLGDGHLLNNHQQLISMDSDYCQLKSRIQEVEESLAVILGQKEELELEAQRFEEYQEVVQKLENHRKLIPYAQLSDMKVQKQDLKRRRDELRLKVDEFQSSLRPLDEEIGKVQDDFNSLTDKSASLESKEASLQRDYEALEKKYTKSMDLIESSKASIVSLLDRSDSKKADMDKIREERSAIFSKRSQLPEIDETKLETLNAEIESKNDVATTQQTEINQLEDSIETNREPIRRVQLNLASLEKKLQSKDKLQVLEPSQNYVNKSQEASYIVHKALRERPEFTDLYFEAPVVCCETPDKSYANYLEKAIDRNTLFAPTVTSSEMFSRLSTFADRHANLPIRNVEINPDDVFPPSPPVPVNVIKEMGFDGYLLDFIRGPREVLTMLCNTSNIHKIPVSKRGLSEHQIKNMISFMERNQVPMNKFFSGQDLFITSTSKYGSKQFYYRTERFPGRAHYFGVDGLSREHKDHLTREIESQRKLEESLKNQVRQIQEKLRGVNQVHEITQKQINDLKFQVNDLHKQKTLRAKYDGALISRDEIIRSLERESRKDYTEGIEKIKDKIDSSYRENAATMGKSAQITAELSSTIIERNLIDLSLLQAANKERSLRKLKQEYEQQLDLIKIEYETARSRYDEIKNSDAAKALRDQNSKYTVAEKEILTELATEYIGNNSFTEEFVRNKINQLEDEKALKSTADQSSLESLQKKLADIDTLEKQLPGLKSDYQRLEKRINDLRLLWEPELTNLVNQTSIQFNKKFTKVASDGRVELHKSDRFQDWKLHILVKFRQESELKILDHQSQSGGERAVSTIFFIMSLQGLTDAPFRVVDEINQGMDPSNERLAHKYLVHTACQNNKSQYFLVTPKLLTGLYYHPDMVVHCIYTGPLIPPNDKSPEKIDFMDFVGKALVAS